METDIKAAVAWNEGDSGVWAAWANPAAGLREALQLPPGRTGKKLVAEAVKDLARMDAAAARAAVATLTAGGPRLAGMAALAEGLAVRDPIGALEVLRCLSWQDYYAQARPRTVWRGERRGSARSG